MELPKNTQKNNLRLLPSVHLLLEMPAVRELEAILPPSVLTAAARTVLAQARTALLSENAPAANIPNADTLALRTANEALRLAEPSLQAAVNAAGIVLHTGLGRARLAPAACDALLAVAAHHANVEIERKTGQRGQRRDHVRNLLCELTGAEDAAVVNNCAGAVFLAVTALAQNREVLISRGELVEIGGAFRMPDIVRASGAALIEVGTTNRTRIKDYAAAVTERTGLILRCRPSNFAVVGFTEEAAGAELAALAREHQLPFMDDQGSGALLDTAQFGIGGGKGTLRDSLAAGADIVTASGDKLLGGPQAGLILGRSQYIETIAAHPLARALRVDKFTLAALEATLRLYRDPQQAMKVIPTLRYLARTESELRGMAQILARKLRAVLPKDKFAISLVSENSQVGGGSLPGENLPTVCVSLRSLSDSLSPDAMAALLRRATPAVFARIKAEAILFDPRTLEREEFAAIVRAAQHLTANARTPEE